MSNHTFHFGQQELVMQGRLSAACFLPAILSIPITAVIIWIINPSIVDIPSLISIAGAGLLLVTLMALVFGRTSSLPIAFLVCIGILATLAFISSIVVTFTAIFVVISYYIWSRRKGELQASETDRKKEILILSGIISAIAAYNLQFIPVDNAFLFSSDRATVGDPDWLFKMLLAIMVKEHGVVTTGLHGTPWLQYHLTPSVLLAAISRMTGSSLASVLTYVYCLIINPLLMATVIYLSTQLAPPQKQEPMQIRWVWFLILLGGIFPIGMLVGGYYTGVYSSIGFLVLMVFTTALLEEKRNVFICSILIVLLTLTKVPFGFMGHILVVGFIAYDGIFRRRIDFQLVFILLSGGLVFYLFWFVLAESPGDSNPFYPGSVFNLFDVVKVFRASSDVGLILAWFGWSGELMSKIGSLLIGLIGVYWVFFVSYIYLLRKSRPHLKQFQFGLFFVAVLGCGALSLRFMNGNHLYFSNFASLISLPVIIGALGSSIKFRRPKGKIKTLLLCILVGTGGSAFLLQTESAVSKIRSVAVSNGEESSINDPTLKVLAELGELDTHQNYLVYVPPNDQFWHNCGPRQAFNIPLVSKRPGLRSLVYCSLNGVLWGPQNYYWWTYGYESYGRGDFKNSQEVSVSRDVLCSETMALGFQGYFHIQDGQAGDAITCN